MTRVPRVNCEASCISPAGVCLYVTVDFNQPDGSLYIL